MDDIDLNKYRDQSVSWMRRNAVWITVALVTVLCLTLVVTCANAAEHAKLRLCSGTVTGNYFYAANILEKNAQDSVKVAVLETQGSMQNLEKLSDQSCDGAFVQTDALLVYQNRNPRALGALERVGVLYKEYVHLVCNKSVGIDRVTGLTKAMTVAVGPLGSGSAVTWDGFVLADKKKYGPVPTSPLAGLRALSAVKDGSSVQCMLFTAALNSTFVRDDIGGAADRVKLIAANDADFDNAKDARGRHIYTMDDIPGGTYGKLQSGLFSGVKTVSVEAVIVLRTEWVEANERAFDQLARALQRSDAEIKKRVGQ